MNVMIIQTIVKLEVSVSTLLEAIAVSVTKVTKSVTVAVTVLVREACTHCLFVCYVLVY